MLIRLIYKSLPSQPISDPFLNRLHAEAATRNVKFGVTGFLHYGAGGFLQILEGEAAVVEQLAENIRADARHRDFLLLLKEGIAQRAFPHWSMQLLRIRDRSLPDTTRKSISFPSLSDAAARLSGDASRIVQRHAEICHWSPACRRCRCSPGW